METELKPCNHTKVTASTTKSPEEIRVLIGICVNHKSIRSHNFCREDMVTGQAVLGRQVADAATEAKPCYPSRNNHTARCDETECLRRRVEIDPGRAAFGASDPCLRIHFDFTHL